MTRTGVGAHEASKGPISEQSSTIRLFRGAKAPTCSNSGWVIMVMTKLISRWWKSILTSRICKISLMTRLWSSRICSGRTLCCWIPRLLTAHTRCLYHQCSNKCLGLKTQSCRAPVNASHHSLWIIKIQTKLSASSRIWSASAMKLLKTSSFGRLKSYLSSVSLMRHWKKSTNSREKTSRGSFNHRKMAQ